MPVGVWYNSKTKKWVACVDIGDMLLFGEYKSFHKALKAYKKQALIHSMTE